MKTNIYQCTNCDNQDICNQQNEFKEFAIRIHEVERPNMFEAVAYCPYYRFNFIKFNKGVKNEKD